MPQCNSVQQNHMKCQRDKLWRENMKSHSREWKHKCLGLNASLTRDKEFMQYVNLSISGSSLLSNKQERSAFKPDFQNFKSYRL